MKFTIQKSDECDVRIPRHTSHVTFTAPKRSVGGRHVAAFTLIEVLAALLFLAIVIPAAVEALHLASLAGVVAARKGAAARVADRVLNESIVMTNWNTGTQNGTVTEGAQEFRWTLTSQNWPVDAMELITAEVKYSAQGRDYSVKLSTLANPLALTTTMGSQR
jgi:type II secretory pathway pseudopilin PulG